jgi:hypothetical protein
MGSKMACVYVPSYCFRGGLNATLRRRKRFN